MTRITFHAEQDHIERLQRLSESDGLTVAEHIRRSIVSYLEEHAPDKSKTLKYKGYVLVVSVDVHDCLTGRGRGPIGEMRLQADSIKDLRRLFEWNVDRLLAYINDGKPEDKP